MKHASRWAPGRNCILIQILLLIILRFLNSKFGSLLFSELVLMVSRILRLIRLRRRLRLAGSGRARCSTCSHFTISFIVKKSNLLLVNFDLRTAQKVFKKIAQKRLTQFPILARKTSPVFQQYIAIRISVEQL